MRSPTLHGYYFGVKQEAARVARICRTRIKTNPPPREERGDHGMEEEEEEEAKISK